MLKCVRPYRVWLVSGIFASIVYALLHSVSILGALPILKVLLEHEGLHGWVDRVVAGERLDVELHVRDTLDESAAGAVIVVQDVSSASSLYAQGLRPGDHIVPGDRELTARLWLEQIADSPGGHTISFMGQPAGNAQAAAIPFELSLEPASFAWIQARRLVSFVPDDDTKNARLTALTYVLAGVVLVVLLANFCRFVGEYLIALSVVRGMMDVRRALYAKVLKLPMSRFTRDTGDMVSRFVQDVQDVQRGLKTFFGKTIREPLKAIFILGVALTMDWRITLTMLSITPVAVLIFWRVGASMKKANRKLLRGYGTMLDALTETVASIAVVKAYTTEHTERRRLWQIDRNIYAEQAKLVRLEAMLSPILEVLGVIAISAVTVWLGGRVIDGSITPARFGTIVILLGMMSDPLRKLADIYTRMIRSTAGAERLYEILDAPDETEVVAGTTELHKFEKSIEFRNVTFTYPESELPALRDISLKVAAGETIALVGPNGSGKTTFINLLLRFYDPQEGALFIDDTDIRTATLRSLRKLMGLVTQDTVIFPIPIADNIAYGARNGSGDAARDSVIDAARRAYADDFIRTKQDGYDTVPGQMGRTLSGGQKQRIAIARAILRDPPILVFDEATSQIDTESEQKIQAALQEFSKGRTTFIVAHRLSTIRFADRIVVLDSGQLIDTGTHEDLQVRCPLYKTLCQTQLEA